MDESRIWYNTLKLYREEAALPQKIYIALDGLNDILPCQASSMFLFDEYAVNLKLIKRPNISPSLEIPSFGKNTATWRMFDSNTSTILDEKSLKNGFPSPEIFFEKVAKLKSIAATPVFDDKNNKIGLIRLINKTRVQDKIVDFDPSDLQPLESSAGLIGTLITIATLRDRFEAFLDSVTHELLAPVSGVKNAGAFMSNIARRSNFMEDPDMRSSFESKIDDILRFSEQAIFLIQGLTMYTKSGRMSKTDLIIEHSHLSKHIIDKCSGSLTPLLGARNFKHYNIRCKNKGYWPMLNIDRKIFRQIFNNMLSNSIKYAHDDPEAFNVEIELSVNPSGGANIIIQDYGIGIEKEEAERIFEPTFRGRKAKTKVTTGTGIGLTTVKNLLFAHDSEITVTNFSNPTEFTIFLPEKFVARRKYGPIHRR